MPHMPANCSIKVIIANLHPRSSRRSIAARYGSIRPTSNVFRGENQFGGNERRFSFVFSSHAEYPEFPTTDDKFFLFRVFSARNPGLAAMTVQGINGSLTKKVLPDAQNRGLLPSAEFV